MTENEKREPVTEALHEHRVLQELIRSLVGLLAPNQELRPEASEKVARDLENLRGRLERHFQFEEDEGLFEDILEKFPMAEAEVSGLRREHGEFLEVVDSLVRRAREVVETLRTDMERFSEAFDRHEGVENDLLQRVYYLDLGSPG